MKSNSEIADDLGLSVSYVSRLRSGERAPSPQVVLKAADTYGWKAARVLSWLRAIADDGPEGSAKWLKRNLK